jgi:hypothetical protein
MAKVIRLFTATACGPVQEAMPSSAELYRRAEDLEVKARHIRELADERLVWEMERSLAPERR